MIEFLIFFTVLTVAMICANYTANWLEKKFTKRGDNDADV